MAYQTGTATSSVDLLDKFRQFAVAQGWTVNRWAVAGSGYELCISKGTAYFNFRAWANESMVVNGSVTAGKYGITMNGSDGYSAGSAWDRQPGFPARQSGTAGSEQYQTLMPLHVNSGPFPAYHFFAPDSKTLYAELEQATGIFVRFGCGSLDLFNPTAPGDGRFIYATASSHVDASTGSYTWLGSYIDSPQYAAECVPFRAADFDNSPQSNWRTAASILRVQSGSYSAWANSARTAGTYMLGMACAGGGVHDKILRDGASPLNGTALLLPNIVSLNVADQYLSPVGVVPGMRYLDMTNFQSGDEFMLGPDTWKVFPWYQKGGWSLQRGIAYLKV